MKKNDQNKTIGETLTIVRIFDAPREEVWKYWTEAERMMKWWGPETFTSPYSKIDARVGGKYLHCMHGAAGPEAPVRDYWNTGVYKELERPSKIVYTDSFSDEKGKVVPATYYGMSADFPKEMLVTVTLEDATEDKTKMLLRHAGMPASDIESARMGWNGSFDKLAAALKE
jgi:uncharacterized protein YndB with AHSA1/START domain